ncbi:Transglycosylase-like domain-containing protein [Actinopolyspora xinjiangensis]|uniref:Transglycosylase-like domain-containing protein n=1 Tax=Actinopolyspora xinjiangensis TaxID=405564 RepID=A0A1H0QJ18_9ACTN|nr:Transglycosylase-like domain-containing protein [Actinopolyspora xinjiangensis]
MLTGSLDAVAAPLRRGDSAARNHGGEVVMTARHVPRGAILLTAALTATLGVGSPAVAAEHPRAADRGVWDRLAECESGGDWHIDTGNGYYGGL